VTAANHKKLGYIQGYSDCWEKFYGEDRFVVCTKAIAALASWWITFSQQTEN
jgi:hypothetical protein